MALSMKIAGELIRCVRQGELWYRTYVDRKIMASVDPDPPAVNPHSAYLRARCKALQWAIRHRQLWIGDGLQVVMFLALEPGTTFLDIGANIGRITERGAYLVGRNGRVYSFEPSPSSARYLRRRVGWLGLKNVTINEFALGDQSGTATLYEFVEAHGAANSLKPEAWPGHRHSLETKVGVRLLDDYVDENHLGPIRLIKLDVQGSEVDVLRGSARLLASCRRPILFVEVDKYANDAFGRSVSELLQVIAGFEYELFSWREYGLVTVRSEEDIPTTGRDDVICVDLHEHGPFHSRLLRLAERRQSGWSLSQLG